MEANNNNEMSSNGSVKVVSCGQKYHIKHVMWGFGNSQCEALVLALASQYSFGHILYLRFSPC